MLEFANMLNFTAASLGNHEFDDGLDGLIPFVKGMRLRSQRPLLCTCKEMPVIPVNKVVVEKEGRGRGRETQGSLNPQKNFSQRLSDIQLGSIL
jgi:hypothetical protein